jgi:hypothetical protein
MGLLSDFKEFLYEYKVIPLAIALIMGLAATAFVKSFVDCGSCKSAYWKKRRDSFKRYC